jgi:hypothetical protein
MRSVFVGCAFRSRFPSFPRACSEDRRSDSNERGAFLDGHHDPDGREEGTIGITDQLGEYLATLA